jgi:hypothetical protein
MACISWLPDGSILSVKLSNLKNLKWILGLFETILIIKGKILDRIKGFFNNGETESKIDRF